MLMMLGVCAGGYGKEFPADAHDAGFLLAAREKSFQLLLMLLGVCAGS